MLLPDKNAVIYGGGGAIGGAAARAFAREGAKVFLAGRTLDKLDQVARGISAAGGLAETAKVDALDERAVDQHADVMADNAGGIDIALNAVGVSHVQGTPFADLRPDAVPEAVSTCLTSVGRSFRRRLRKQTRRSGSASHTGHHPLRRIPQSRSCPTGR